jgi:lysozyme
MHAQSKRRVNKRHGPEHACFTVDMLVVCLPDEHHPPVVTVLAPSPMPSPKPGPTPGPAPTVGLPGGDISTMSVDERGREFIRAFEQGPEGSGRPALKCYDDHDKKYYLDLKKEGKLQGRPIGYWTNGYGHLASAGECESVITEQKAKQLFEHDLEHKSVRIIKRLVKVKLTQDQLNALASYVYNTGSLQGTKLLKYINKGDFKAAVKEMDIETSGGKKLRGLKIRREAEHEIWNNGRYEIH